MNNTKKKIACLALASALVIPGVVGLTGCNKGHTHAFDYKEFYEVIDGKAYGWNTCSCGAEDAHKEVKNAVIVTPETAQSALDGKIILRDGKYVVGQLQQGEEYAGLNNKTIIFNGTFTEQLSIRPTKLTAKVFDYTIQHVVIGQDSDGEDKTKPQITKGNEITGELTGVSADYLYEREVKNVKFAATNNSLFKNRFVGLSGLGDAGSNVSTSYESYKDYVLSDEGVEFASVTDAYKFSLKIDNIQFVNMKFEAVSEATETSSNVAQIRFWSNSNLCSYKNIKIKNCDFKGNETVKALNIRNSSIHIVNDWNNNNENITIENCVSDNYAQGVSIWAAKNILVKGNKITNTRHNCVCINNNEYEYGPVVTYNMGDVIVENNILEESGNMAIKINCLKDANVKVKNNTIINTIKIKESWPYLFQQGDAINTSYTWENNTFNSNKVIDINGSVENHDWFYIFLPGYSKTTGQSK